jgi:hypothetical protein
VVASLARSRLRPTALARDTVEPGAARGRAVPDRETDFGHPGQGRSLTRGLADTTPLDIVVA